MKKFRNRIVSGILALTMVASMLPAGVFSPAAKAAPSGALELQSAEIYTDGSYKIVYASNRTNSLPNNVWDYLMISLDAIETYSTVNTPSEDMGGEISADSANSTSGLGNLLKGYGLTDAMFKPAVPMPTPTVGGSSRNWTYTFEGKISGLTETAIKNAITTSGKTYYDKDGNAISTAGTLPMVVFLRCNNPVALGGGSVPMTAAPEKLPADLTGSPNPVDSESYFSGLDLTITLTNGIGLETAVVQPNKISFTGDLAGGKMKYNNDISSTNIAAGDSATLSFNVPGGLPTSTLAEMIGSIQIPYTDGLGNTKTAEIQVNLANPNAYLSSGTIVITMGTSDTKSGKATIKNLTPNDASYSTPLDLYLINPANAFDLLSTNYTEKVDPTPSAGGTFTTKLTDSSGSALGRVSWDGMTADTTGAVGVVSGGTFDLYFEVTTSNIAPGTYSAKVTTGWFDSVNYMGGIVSTPVTIIVEEQETTYTLNFNANGGSVTGTNPWTGTDADATFTWPTASNSGKLFKGWYTAASSGTQIATTNNTWNKVKAAGATPSGTAITVYAQWVDEHTITFHANGGNWSGSTNDVTRKTDVDGHIVSNVSNPTRADHTFLGWYESEAAANAATTVGGVTVDTTTPTFSADDEYWAGWKFNSSGVTFDPNGGTFAGPSGSAFTGTSAVTVQTNTSHQVDPWPTNPTRSGYFFNGWKDGSGNVKTSADTFTSATTLTAQWVEEYTITFDADGGAPSSQAIKTDINGALVSQPTQPTKANYNFGGWYTAKNGGGSRVDPATETFSSSQTLYAKWTEGEYTPKLTLLEEDGSTKVTGASSVYIAKDASGTGACNLTEGSGANAGIYSGTAGATNEYTHATFTVDGATYTVELADPITSTDDEESVTLYVITLKVGTTVSGSAAPYGSAVARAGGKDFTATDATGVTFHAPNITDAVTLKSTTPATNYTDKAGKNWTVASTDKNTGDTFAPTTATTVTAFFTPHGVLDFYPDPITATVKAGYSDKVIVTASSDGASDGYLENVGPGAIPGISYSLTKTGTTNWTPSTSLAITGMPTSLAADGSTSPVDWGGVKIELKNGLAVGVYTANLTISSTDDAVADLVVPITITVKEGSQAEAKGNTFKWDTYTEEVTQNKSPSTATTTWTTNLTLEDISSIESLVYGGTTLAATTDYTLGAKAGTGENTYIPITLTTAGLKKLAGLIVPSASGTIVVTAKDNTGAVKQANITMNLEDKMPALKDASFSNVDGNGKWELGNSTLPNLTVTDNINGSAALTGAVTYEWSVNGAVKSGWTAANLTSSETDTLNVGDKVTVKVTGTGEPWAAKSTAVSPNTNLYKKSVSVTASFEVKLPALTVKIKLDGNDYTTPGSGDKITVDTPTDLGGSVMLGTGTNNAKKYVFVNWTVETNGGGIFGVSGSATTSTSTTPIFTPAKAATVVANWVSIATVEYTHGANATGPNAKSTSSAPVNDQYEETLKNVGAKATDIKSVVIDDTTNFTLTVPATGVKGALAAGATTADKFVIKPVAGLAAATYTIKVTTTYANAAPDGADATTATVVQTVVYVVPEPKYDITLAATAGGTNTGNYKGTNYPATSSASKTISVVKNDSVALTATPADGYKFVNWTLTTNAGINSDKLANAITDASNAYGAVTAPNTITATFKAITDLAETHSKTSETVNVGYSGAQDVYLGTVTNSGALNTSVKYELSGSDAANFTIATPSLTSSIAAIGAGKPTASSNVHNVKVQAVAGLGVGTYHANLVITEQTDDADDTKNGIQTWTIPITFTVGGGSAEIEVKLDTNYKDAETVTLLAGTSVIPTTAPASPSHKYTASGLTIGTSYKILVNGVDTGVTVKANDATTAGAATVQLWTLTTADDGNGTVSVSGGTQVTITEGTAATNDDSIGYVNNCNVKISAVPNANYHFKEWEDKTPNLSWTSNKDTTNPKTIAMTAARSVEAHFEKNIEKDTYATVNYYKNYDGSKGTTANDFLFKNTVMLTNGSASVPLYAGPTRPGYTFDKWILADGTDCANPMTVTEDVNVFATWTKADATWSALPNGTYGTAYSGNAIITNGNATGPVTYTYTGTKTGGSGTAAAPYNGLPDGLTLAANGTLSGTPRETGVFKFQVTATGTDAANNTLTWTNDFTITITKAKPTLSGISFAGVSEGALKGNVTVYGNVDAPLYDAGASTPAWVANGKTYTYSASATPSPNPGALSVTSPNTLNFSGNTTLDGTVKFTPSTTVATGLTGTHQTAQKFDDIYLPVEDPCVFNLGGQVWDVVVDPTNKTFGPYDFGTATTSDTQAFKVTNKGNQDVYLQYVWKDPTTDFALTGTDDYNNTSGSGASAVKSDKLDTTTSGKEITAAFTVAPSLSATKAPGTYTANVAVNVYKDAACTQLAKTILVPVTYTIDSTDYDVTVQIDLTPVSGSKKEHQEVPSNGAVTFVAADGTTIAGVFDGTVGSDGVYKAKLPGGKAFDVYVNGIDTTKDVDKDNTSAVVDMYELALEQDTTSNGVQDITGAQSGEGYYLSGQEVAVSTPPSCGANSNNYDFEKWVKGGSDESTDNPYTYTMPAEAVTLTANYKKRASDTVVVNYYDGYSSPEKLLWNQSVTKSTKFNVSSTVPTRNGYVFEEWKDTTTNTTYASGAEIAAGITADMDLHAQWTKLTATFPTSVKNTYYSERYSASVAASWKNGDAAANAPAVTYTVTTTGVTAGTGETAGLPGGLTMGATGVITGRAYQVGTFKFKVVATAVGDTNTTWTSDVLTIVVTKETPRLANAGGENANISAKYSTGIYYADVVADIYKETKDGVDVWEDGKVIIGAYDATNNTSGLLFNGSGSGASSTAAADGGVLSIDKLDSVPNQTNTAANEGDTTFTSGNNEVPLLWTPGETKDGYPFRDGNSNKWGDIFFKAETKVYLTPGSEYKLKVEPTVIKFKVTVNKSDYKVYDASVSGADKYVAIDGAATGAGKTSADNITITNDGNMPIHVEWALDGTNASTYFSAPTDSTSREELATKNAHKDLFAAPQYNAQVGTYTAQVKVKAYDAATNGNLKGQGDVTLVLEVVEDTTFPFEVDTYFNSFEADTVSGGTTTAVPGSRDLHDVTSVELKSIETTPVTPSATHTANSGKYGFTLDAAKTYKVLVNGIELPGVRISKTSTTPLDVDLYELELTHDGKGAGDPTAATSSSTSSGYYLPGERVTVTAAAAANTAIHKFGSWDETLEGGKDADDKAIADTTNADFSKANPLSYVMGSKAVKLTAKYEDGKQFKVVLDLNDSTNTAAIGYHGTETYQDVLHGGTKGTDYLVNNGAVFGLDMPVATAAAGKYTITWQDHTFLGWSTDKNATSGGYSFTASQAAANADRADGDTDDDDTITLYAVWSTDNTLKLGEATITGVYKHDITPVFNAATGGTTPYVSYVGANEPFSDTDLILGLKLETVAKDGVNTSKVSGIPTDTTVDAAGVRTPKYSTVTVTDSRTGTANTASALYTIVIEKANVKPDSTKGLPTEVKVDNGKTAAEVEAAILAELAKTQMNGDGTSEDDVNGAWSVVGTAPTTPGTHTVTVKFTPANKDTVATSVDRYGDHYNEYTATIPVVIGGRLITNVKLDKPDAATGAVVMKPEVGQQLKFTVGDVPTTAASRELDPNDATFAASKDADSGDVYIAAVQWAEDGEIVKTNKNAEGGTDYVLTITLAIREGSTWRFDSDDTTGFKDSYISGIKAERVAVNDKIAVIQVKYPQRITTINVETSTPKHGDSDNTVNVPADRVNDYKILSYAWYDIETGDKVDATHTFNKDKYYDLIVTVQLIDPKVVDFSEVIKGTDANALMNDLNDATSGDTATVNKTFPSVAANVTGLTDAEKRFVKAETDYGKVKDLNDLSKEATAKDNAITIRYRAFQPADQTLVSIRVEGVPGTYYAQTKADGNHWKLRHDAADATATVGNTGSKNDVTFTFDPTRLTVYQTFKTTDGNIIKPAGVRLDQTNYKVYAVKDDGTRNEITDSFKDGYTHNSVARKDVEKFDNTKVIVVATEGSEEIIAPVAGILRVQQLRADSIAKVGTSQPATAELRYEVGATFASSLNTMKATVTFNADIDALKNTELAKDVTQLSYAQYSAYAATLATGTWDNQKTFFFEYGENLPTFVAHKTDDPSSLADGLVNASGAWITELVPGTTQMTAAMDGKTLYATYVDVNHNVVRVALGVIDMGSEFEVIIEDVNGPDPEYADRLEAWPKENGTKVTDPNSYKYEWQYWVPSTTGDDQADAPADLTNKKGSWQPLPDTTPDKNAQAHYPGKNEVGEYIRVKATDRTSGTSQVSAEKKIEPRSLNFDVKPWNKSPDKKSENIHKYIDSDFSFKEYQGIGGIANNDVVTLTPKDAWNNTAQAGSKTAVNARPNYRHGDGWDKDLGSAVGDKITWPAIAEDAAATTVDKTGGYTLGGAGATSTTLNSTTAVPVYRLRPQDEIIDRGTIVSVAITDENGHEPEYGDKLTAEPGDDTSGLTYQWQYQKPDGTWTDLPGQTGKDHIPGKKEVGVDIRVVVTDPTDGTKRESAPMTIKARSLNFTVEPKNRIHTDDTFSDNTYEYKAADFTLTTVKMDPDRDASGKITMDGDKMASFSATTTYGGPYGGDDVTLAPKATTTTPAYTSWNDADATRPAYLAEGSSQIAGSPTSGKVKSEIIWPQVFDGNEAKGSTADKKVMELAGQTTDYTLSGSDFTETNLKNTTVEVYRLAPQGEQLNRGEITGGAGGDVTHVNVDFKDYPALGSTIPGHPDAEKADADGTGDVAVTDKRETRPGEVLDHADEAAKYTGDGVGYPGKEYTATWYPAKEGTTGNKDWGAKFDPTDPTTTGGTAINGTFSGPATVLVKVTPRKGYKYHLLGEEGITAKNNTKFHFHFGKDFTVDLPVVGTGKTGAAGVRKVTETKDGKNYDVYYMWYTFKDLKTPAFVSDPLDLGLTADDFIYYANTDVTEVAPATQVKDHHHTANTANNTPIPGGKAAVDFTYVLDKVRTAIENSGNGTKLYRTDGSSITIKSNGYGDAWRLKAGTWSGDTDKKVLDDGKADGSAYKGRTFKDTVNLKGKDPTGTPNTGDSQDYDGLYVYIEVKVGSEWMTYGAPLGVTETGTVTAEALTVKELEAESITAAGSLKAAYENNEAFADVITSFKVDFNVGTPVEVKGYPDATYAAEDIDYTDAKSNEGKAYFYQYANGNSFVDLPVGTLLSRTTYNGKVVYVCYTDVNNHIVRKPLGALVVNEELVEDPISQIIITYPTPITEAKPVATGKDPKWSYNNLVDTARVAVSEDLESGSTYKTEGTTWYTAAAFDPATADADAIKDLAVAGNKLTDSFEADTYYMVEGKIASKGDKWDPNGVKVIINEVTVDVDGAMATKKDANGVTVGWAMAEFVTDNNGTPDNATDDVTYVYARYVAKTQPTIKVGSVAINYHTPAAPNEVKDYANYADTEAVTVPNKDDKDNPTKWYKVATDADTVFASLSSPLTIGTATYAENSIYVVENLVKPNGGYELTTDTTVQVDGHAATVSKAGTVTTIDATAKSGLIKVKAKLNDDGTITVQSLYKVPNNTIDPVSITYPEPVKGQTPTSIRADANKLWTYNALNNDDQVSVAETSTAPVTDPQTDGTTWYTTGLGGKPANAAAIKAEEKDANKLTAAFAANKYYLVVGTITPDTGYNFDFDAADGVTVTVNGIPVKVDGAMAAKSDAQGEEIGWAAAVKSGSNVKVYYVAKTLDDDTVANIGINYTTPAATNAAKEYVTYVDQDKVTVYNYAAAADHDNNKDPDGTKWYPTSASDFNESGKAMMTIGTTQYQPGTHYLVVNVIHPNPGQKLTTDTNVTVDGVLTVAPKDTNPGTTGATTGLLSAKATLNGNGTITIRSIYKVPETKPGQVNSITITYPEPKQDTTPVPNKADANGMWTWQYLSAGVKVEQAQDTGSTNAKKTQGTIWYTTNLTDGDLPFDKTDLTPITSGAGKNVDELKAKFDYDKYYMVQGTIEHDDDKVFADSVTVTINGILVTVGGDVASKYDNEGNAVGWAVAEWAKKVDGKNDDGTDKIVDDHSKILARYVARTEPTPSNVIWKVQATVTEPTVGGTINDTAELDVAKFKNLTSDTDAGDATSNVTTGKVTWSVSDSADGTYTGVAAGGKFEKGKYYKAEFEVSANTGYIFQNDDANGDGTKDDFVAFRINRVLKGDGTWGVNDKKTPDQAESNGIKVKAEQVVEGDPAASNPNKYKITVWFPLNGEPDDLTVIGKAATPTAGKTAGSTNIWVDASEPYEIKKAGGKEVKRWEHWTDAGWQTMTDGETFKAGDFYRAVMDIELKAGQENYYKFTNKTSGQVNDTPATTADDLPNDKPTLNKYRTNIIRRKTGDEVKPIVLAQEFRVPKTPVKVKIQSPVPAVGYVYDITPDTQIHIPAGEGRYTLSDGASVQGQWYDSSFKLLNKNGTFEPGKTYYLVTTATAKDGYYFSSDLSGYEWDLPDGNPKATSASTYFKDAEKIVDGEVVVARVAFEYTIPAPKPVLIPGWAEQPSTGAGLSDIRTEDKDFKIVESWWSKTEQDGDHIAPGTEAEEKATYYAHIKIRPKDGVIVKDDAEYYRFNLNTTADTKFVTWKYLKDEDVYYLVYEFEPTEEEPEPPSGGGGGGTTTVVSPVVYYQLKDKGVTEDPTAEKVKKNSKPTKVPTVKAINGLVFKGWSEVDPSTLTDGKLPTLVDPTTFKITKDKTFYAVYEQGVDHNHYVIGFPNGTFAPDAKITRAEVATIIARSCLEGFVEGANYGNPGNYSDVTTHWAFSAIAFCAREGVFNGYEDGTFRPDRYITRQELATVVARLAGIQTSKDMPFNDKNDIAAWATNGVYTAYANGWIRGYEDGTFQPERDVNRAETVRIFNGYLKRGVDTKGLDGLKEYVHTGVASNNTEDGHDEYMTWPDVPKTHWAYYEIIEAANDHNYHWQDAEKQTPPEDWDEVYIDEKWKYNDNETDGADKRDENISAQKIFTITYLVSSNGVTYDAITETVERFASPKPENMPIAVPNEGYRFAGWSSTDPSTGTITLEDPTASSVTADKWFYAVFEEDKPYQLPVYTVTYVIGALGSYDGATVEQVEMFQAPSPATLPQPTASEGYHFAGWAETDPATGSYAVVDPTANYVTGDKTFYAVYEENKPYQLPIYTVTYVIGENGSYNGATVEQVEMFQAPAPANLPKPKANRGYKFVGWSETDPATGSYTIMDPTANYVTGDKTFYAVYEAV